MKFKNCHLLVFLNHVCKGISVAQMVLVRTWCTWGEELWVPAPHIPSLEPQDFNKFVKITVGKIFCKSGKFMT